jgi:hypothetical protein
LTAWVAALKTFIKETGPLETPPVERTTLFFGLSLEKLNPVPPPLLCIIAVFFIASKIDSIESPTGRTKHADNWPKSLPEFIRVGLFGMNLK